MEIAEIRVKVKELHSLNLSELKELHYNFEIAFAAAIKKAKKGSPERAALVSEAYTILPMLLLEMRKRQNVSQLDSLGAPSNIKKIMSSWFSDGQLKILDVGCGTGYNVINLVQGGFDAYGVDVSQSMIQKGIEAARAVQKIDVSGRLISANFVDWIPPEELGLFDIIWTNDVIEHLPEDEAPDFLLKTFTLLRPGGSLVLITPNRLVGPGDASGIRQPIGSKSQGLHLREYSLNELTTLLSEAGYTEFASPIGSLFGLNQNPQPTWTYWKVKTFIEPFFNLIPGKIRRYLMTRLQYSTLVARKKQGAIN